MERLDLDVLAEILSRLRVKHLTRFKFVCKTWFHFISSQEFIQLHLKRSKFRAIPLRKVYFVACPRICSPPDSCLGCLDCVFSPYSGSGYLVNYNMVLVGSSCDGLVCLFNWEHGIIHIWNPATRASACIPIEKPDHKTDCFWFGRHNDEYKIVLGTGHSHMHLIKPYVNYNSNKSTQEVGYFYYFYTDIGTLFNGNVHWAVLKCRKGHQSYHTILSYDLQQETLGEILLPAPMVYCRTYFTLGEVNGCLSMLLQQDEGGQSELWAMNEYGVKASWTKLMDITACSVTALYNGELREIGLDALVKSPCYTKEAYVESLVSPRLETERALLSE